MDEASYRVDLIQSRFQSKLRGLNQSAKWASELVNSLSSPISSNDLCFNNEVLSHSDYVMAKDCFDLGEFDRCAFFCRNSTSREGRFLHYYSRYMAAEKKRLDMMVDTNPHATSAPHDNITSVSLFSSESFINRQLIESFVHVTALQ